MTLLKGFREKFLDRLIQIHWRQWTSLGVASQIEEENNWIIDLEGLLSSTLFIGKFDKRLLSVSLEWINKNGEWLNSSRLKRIGNYFYKIDKRLNKHLVSQGVFEESQAKSRVTEPNIQKPCLLPLYLRGVFGVNARVEVLLYLLLRHEGNSNQIAKEVYFDQKIVYRILERWTKAGLVEKEEGKKYLLKNEQGFIKMLKLENVLHYINWVRTFLFFARILNALHTKPWSEDEYLLSSFFRDILGEAKIVGRSVDVSFPDGNLYKGSEYLHPFTTEVMKLLRKI